MERFGLPSHRGLSVRSILTFALVVVVTALLWVLTGSQATHAADPTAAWSGDSIVYDNHGYNKVDDFKDATNTVPAGATVYKAPPQTANGSSAQKKVFILYFSPGVDPPTATSVKYVEFNISNTDTVSNPQNTRDVTLTPKGKQDEASSCSVEGIGWIICPVSVFIAEGMDNIFQDVLAPMISVQPTVLGDQNNSMYVAWNVMRNIANVAFVIVFIIIIYSQLTNLGVSNYGLKKLIPRLIIAAILVNVSFIVAAAAIDISNILGYSIQNIFNTIRENLFQLTNDNVSGINSDDSPWTSVTAIILAGGGVVGGVYYVATGGLWLLIPLLLGLISILILVVVVLAARQAIIVILVIIAPIAFVANLLPNTEKWFDKWKDLFFTMLIFFPAFSLVFGGSQLAGQLIIQSANDNLIMLLFGLAVQIAPLVITPLLLKLSGSLLGRIAQIANNPSKGLLDRNRKWAESRAEYTKQRNLAGKGKFYNPTSWGAGMVRGSDFRKRRLQDKTNTFKQIGDNLYHDSKKYEKIHEDAHGAELDKQFVENKHTAHIQGKVAKDGSPLNIKSVRLEDAKVSAERANAQTAEMMSGYRAGSYDTAGNARLANLQRNMAENVIQTAAWKQGEENNKYVMQRGVSDRMRKDSALLDIAEGYGTEELRLIGRERAQSSAVATLTKLNADARQNTITLMQTEAVEAKMTIPQFAKERIFDLAKSANAAERDSISKSRLEAALEIAIQDGQVSVFDEARENEWIDQDLIDAVVARNVPTFKQKGGFHTQRNPKLSLQRYLEDFRNNDTSHGTTEEEVRNSFATDLKLARLDTLSNTTAEHFKDVKAGTFANYAKEMGDLLSVIPTDENNVPISEDHKAMLNRIHIAFRGALGNEETRLGMTDRLEPAAAIEEILREKFYSDTPILKVTEPEREQAGGGKRGATDVNTDIRDADPTASSPSEENND
jgi:hypothetical protein